MFNGLLGVLKRPVPLFLPGSCPTLSFTVSSVSKSPPLFFVNSPRLIYPFPHPWALTETSVTSPELRPRCSPHNVRVYGWGFGVFPKAPPNSFLDDNLRVCWLTWRQQALVFSPMTTSRFFPSCRSCVASSLPFSGAVDGRDRFLTQLETIFFVYFRMPKICLLPNFAGGRKTCLAVDYLGLSSV